jgi:hypothetical protein
VVALNSPTEAVTRINQRGRVSVLVEVVDQVLAADRRRYIATPARPRPAISTPAAICAIGTLLSEPVVGSSPDGVGAATVRMAVAVMPLSAAVAVTTYVPGAVGAVKVTVAVPVAGCPIARAAPPPVPVHVAESLSPETLTETTSPSVHPVNVAPKLPPGLTVDGDNVRLAAPGG